MGSRDRTENGLSFWKAAVPDSLKILRNIKNRKRQKNEKSGAPEKEFPIF